MSNDDNNSNSNSRGDEDDAEDYTFDCTTAPYGRTCVSADRQEKREIDPLKRACEEHQAKRRRMEIYYNVPQGGKVTDKQRQSYRDNDERMEDVLLDAAVLHRLLNSNNEKDDNDDYGPPTPLMDRYMADALQHINQPNIPRTGGRQLQRMDYLPFDGDSDSEEEEEKEKDRWS